MKISTEKKIEIIKFFQKKQLENLDLLPDLIINEACIEIDLHWKELGVSEWEECTINFTDDNYKDVVNSFIENLREKLSMNVGVKLY